MKTKLRHIAIYRAESPEQRERLFRFRYQVYVEEMGRSQRYADQERKRIEEPFDATAANFIAVAGDEIVGCIRWNSGLDTDFAEYVDLYDMRRAGPYFPHHCGTTTKLMVAPAYRRTALVVLLCRALYAYGRSRGVLADFMDCNSHLEGQFARFGYRPYRSRVTHTEYGNVLPMLLVCTDLDHLAAVRSPLAIIESHHPRRPDVTAYFHNRFFNAHRINGYDPSNTFAHARRRSLFGVYHSSAAGYPAASVA